MNIVYFVSLYIAGYIVSFIFLRWIVKQEEGSWTKSDRQFFFRFSLLSWLAFGIALLYVLFDDVSLNNEDSNDDI